MLKHFGFIFIVFFICSSCKETIYPLVKISGFAQGTTFNITYENSVGKNYNQAIDSILKKIDNSLSIYNLGSIISRINKNDPSAITDEYFNTVFKKSVEINELSGGAFDITVGPLVNAWGFGPEARKKMDKTKIDSLLLLVGMNKIKLNGNKIIKENPNCKIDVNAIAQGYTVDVICDFFDKEGLKNYLVEVGGEVRGKGCKANNKKWRVGIDKPENDTIPDRKLQAIIELENKALATSGNYRKFYEENGVKYSHTINPKTGYPAKNTLLSVSIIANDCTTADALATACMVIGLDESRQMLKKLSDVDAYFIYCDESGNYKTEYTEYLNKILVK
jgi:thiamine biosynthesis lipoprotein